ncbi:hypothetical protein [Natrarchaeobius oligotrophus]|uniref:Uncharacterized protein n=1 Tax=Natrarchaeobius chitinivorans TaxID=1679083 RepID=A0A3N6MG88_NATCH|nr:hypothetical protein [Natrarchaeobius chitinivorans]RQH03074.1 hypothetical protein EA472_00280 [Natrarchaeobius chitinivorans]
MTTSMTIGIPIVVAIFRLLQPVGGRTIGRLRERVRVLVPFVLALAFVVLATIGYLEVVASLLEFVG